ncbi:MAG: hypothetical protein A3D28_06225 [Omnitrophica bacterium RIFCSPHIGHO2_02_FULL_63_14]|nr:MAG: hypothetical protein A3D28_06225 [Omnitrophica bacterium RIFCSPHIGHO2_02_FULL_63_14]
MSADDKGYYESRFSPDPGRDRVWPVICRYLQRFIPPDASVLDLGAGYCSFINHIRARDKFALDRHPDLARFAAPGVRTFVRGCEDLGPFRDATLDVVFASNLFEHLDEDTLAKTVDETRRVLKPGGRIILIQPNFKHAAREYFDDYTHKKVFTDVSLADYLRSRGFVVKRVEPRFLLISMKARVPKHPALVALYLRLPFRPFAKQMLVMAEKP